MGEQYDLFVGVPYVKGSDTSKAAAESMVTSAKSIRGRIWRLVSRFGDLGMTCDEVEAQTRYKHQTASARLRELFQAGRLRKAGKRPTRSGRQAWIYVAIDQAASGEGEQ